MAKVEIEEAELNDFRRLRNVVETINKHPKGGLLLEEAHKLINPEAKTPRLDQMSEASKPLDEMRKEMADLKKALADEKAENDKNSKLSALQKKVEEGKSKLMSDGWTADGIKLLEKFQEESGILDPLDAAAAYERRNGPQTAPVTPSSHFGRWDFTEVPEGQENYAKKLLETRGDNETLVTQEATKAVQEFRNQFGQNRR